MKEELLQKTSGVRRAFRRFNQTVLSFPVWLVVGISGLFRQQEQEGWQKSEKNEDYEKMY